MTGQTEKLHIFIGTETNLSNLKKTSLKEDIISSKVQDRKEIIRLQ
jgi:hypothetical protein